MIYAIPSFVGHGKKKGNVEIQDRDVLANYIFNEVTLDGIKGIGKAGKDNGLLILLSLEPYTPFEATATAQTTVPEVNLTP